MLSVNVQINNEAPAAQRRMLIVNGVLSPRSYVRPRASSEDRISCRIRDEQTIETILGESFDETSKHFSEILLSLSVPGLEDLFRETAIVSSIQDGKAVKFISKILRPILPKWSKPWSYLQYLETFVDEVKRKSADGFSILDDEAASEFRLIGGVNVVATEFDGKETIREISERLSAFVSCVNDTVERQLTANLNRGSLVTFFDFPPTVRVACEQYLQYFIQFLDDLGIEADSEISSNAGRVLFSVTPRSGEEALEAIQKALAAYIELPTNTETGGYDLVGSDFAVSQLRSNILHLQGQLMTAQAMHQLAQATIQAKDATINAQAMQLSAFQGTQIVQIGSDPKQIESTSRLPREDSEPLIGNSVKLTTLKMKGVEIDLPGLLRSLKRKLPGGGTRS